jgi:endonuclease/exonuclease/phosphatase family metal-dependent hydrolase
MAYNILEGGIGRIDPLAEIIRQVNPDCVVVAEASDRAEFEKLARRLGMDHFLAQSPCDPAAAVGLLSRLEISEATNIGAIDHRFTRAALRAVLRHEEIEFGIVGVHLHARERLTDEAVRLTEIPAVLDAAQVFRACGMAHALAGDFNATSPEQLVDLTKLRPKSRARIDELADVIPRDAIAALLAGGYVDSHAIGRTAAEFACSFTTAHPALRVDYVFLPQQMQSRVVGGQVFIHALGKYASDHFPVYCDLEI